MPPWRAVGSVIVGIGVTIVLTGVTIVLLPVIGFATADIVGNWLPPWVFVVPPTIGAILGGATTGYLHGNTPRKSAILGCIATAVGLTAIGAVVGLVFLLLMLGMTPAHGQEVDFSKAALTMVALGSGVGFISGAIFGAIGGAGGHVGRQKFSV